VRELIRRDRPKSSSAFAGAISFASWRRGPGGSAGLWLLLLSRILLAALGHSPTVRGSADEDGEERHLDHEDDPQRLPPAVNLAVAEEIADGAVIVI